MAVVEAESKQSVLQGNYTVNPGANPDSHLWILCNPDIPRQTPFVLDLGGSVLIFEVSPSSLGIAPTGRALASKPKPGHSSMDRVPWQQAGRNSLLESTHVLQDSSLHPFCVDNSDHNSIGIAGLAVIAQLLSAGSVIKHAYSH